jgi:hypothetical protein
MMAKSSDNREPFEQKVTIPQKKNSVIMETNKFKYSTKDEVKYRVLVLNSEMKPHSFEKLEFFITDGNKALAFNTTLRASKYGVYEGAYRIPQNAIQGKWGIHVIVDGGNRKKINFQVEEYNLPTFQVHLKPTSSNVLLASRTLRATIYANRIVGKGEVVLSGTATVTASAFDPRDSKNAIRQGKTKKVQVNGKNSQVTFDMASDLHITDYFNQTLVKLDVAFEDDSTKRIESASSTVMVYKFATFRFEDISEKEFITPGMPYKFRVMVKKFDGSVMKKSDVISLELLNIFYVNSCSNTQQRSRQLTLNPMQINLVDGIAEYEIQVPENAHGMYVRVMFKQSTFWFKLRRVPTNTRENLNVNIKTEKYEKSCGLRSIWI